MNASKFLYRVYVIIRWFSRALGIMRWVDRSKFSIQAAHWMRERIAGAEVVVARDPIDGHEMKLTPDYVDLIKGGGYEKGTTRVLTKLAKEGMNIVDIGANVGYYTLLAAKRVGSHGKVYAFEPEPRNFELLMENIRLNSYENVIATQRAVSNESGTASLFLSPRCSGAHSLVSTRDPGNETIAVGTVTLDEFFEREGWPAIQVIKMDIEGWEMEALDGMHKLIIRNSPLTIVVEFYPWGMLGRGMKPLALADTLTRLGFSLSVIDEETGRATPFAEYHHGQAVEFVEKTKGSVNLLCQK
jgi:FkbM family methyltransferase